MSVTYYDPLCYELIDESPQYEFDKTGGSGTRKFHCQWNQFWTKLATVMSLPTPGLEMLTCVRAQVEPLGIEAASTNSTSGCGADWLVVTTYFQTLFDSADGFTYNIEQLADVLDCGTETTPNYITVPKNIETYEFTLWTDYPRDLVMSLQNTVNDAEWRGWPAGCAHFLGANASQQYDFLTQSWKWRVTLRFETRSFSWNQYWDKTTGAWATGTLFTSSDFTGALSAFGL